MALLPCPFSARKKKDGRESILLPKIGVARYFVELINRVYYLSTQAGVPSMLGPHGSYRLWTVRGHTHRIVAVDLA